MSVRADNPYAGPRPFDESRRAFFFGREWETRELSLLVIAHREIVLHSPSGAGKTSLLQAGLYPALQQRGVDVLPRARVGGEATVDLPADRNVYVENVLAHWMTAEERREAGVTTLAGYLARRPRPESVQKLAPRVIVLDQFEELFTTYPDRWADREPFLEHVAEALDADDSIRVLFAMRDEFVALMRAHGALFPEGLRTWFHLQRLKQDAAERAVEDPTREPPVTGESRFENGVAANLVRRLRQARLRTKGGGAREYAAEFVEPVHLQIVCSRLWDALPPRAVHPAITVADLDRLANVEVALLAYYRETLAAVAATDAATRARRSERHLYRWFERELVSATGVRVAVRAEEESVAGLPIAIVRELDRRYLVRAEPRGDSMYYELSHDRFVRAVQEAAKQRSAGWLPLAAAAALVLIIAVVWFGYLASQASTALQQANARVEQVSADLREEASQIADAAVHDEHPSTYLQRMLRVAASTYPLADDPSGRTISHALQLAVNTAPLRWLMEPGGPLVRALAIDPGGKRLFTVAERGHIRQWDLANKSGVAGWTVGEDLQLAHASRDGAFAVLGGGTGGRVRVELVRLDARDAAPVTFPFTGARTITAVAVSGEGRRVAAAGLTDEGRPIVTMWNVGTRRARTAVIDIEMRRVVALAFSATGASLAGVGRGRRGGVGRVWSADSGAQSVRLTAADEQEITAVAFSPEVRTSYGRFDSCDLATGGYGGVVQVWALPEAERFTARRGLSTPCGSARIFGIVRVRAADDDTAVPAATGEGAVPHLRPSPFGGRGHTAMVTALAYDVNGRVVSASADKTVRLWDVNGREIDILFGHGADVAALVAARDRAVLATAGPDGVIVWDTAYGEDQRTIVPESEVTSISADGRLILLQRASTRDSLEPNLLSYSSPQLAGTGSMRASPYADAISVGAGGAVAVGSSGGWAFDVVDLAAKKTRPLPRGGLVAVAAPASGEVIATANWEGRITLLDPRRPHQPIRTMMHDRGAWDVTFSPDGATLASAGPSGTVRLWEVATGKVRELKTSAATPADVRRVAFSPDGRLLAAARWSGDVQLWDVASGALLRTLSGHARPVNAVAFDGAGKILATGGSDGTIRLWEVSARSDPRTIKAGARAVRDVAFDAAGQRVAAAHLDGIVTVWNVAAGTRRLRINAHRGPVWSVAFSRDGTTLLTAGGDGTASLWNAETGASLRALKGHLAAVNEAIFLGERTRVASVSDDTSCRVWDGDKARELLVHADRSAERTAFAVHPSERALVAADAHRRLRVVDLSTGIELRSVADGPQNAVSIAFTADGARFATLDAAGAIQVREWPSLALRDKAGPRIEREQLNLSALALAGNGLRAASSGSAGPVIWDLSTRAFITTDGPAAPAIAMAFSPAGDSLAAISMDRRLRIWRVESGTPVVSWPSFGAVSLVFSSDGRYLVTVAPTELRRYSMAALVQGSLKEVMAVGFERLGGDINRAIASALRGRIDDARARIERVPSNDAARIRAEKAGLLAKLRNGTWSERDLATFLQEAPTGAQAPAGR